jgi:HK97 family phage portal protein
MKFVNKRAAAWWGLREMLETLPIGLPPDDLLTGDLTAPKWTEKSGGRIQVESKKEIKKRIGRSTDDGDAVVMVMFEKRSGDKVKGEAAAYAMVPLIYRAVKLRSDSIASVPVNVYRGDEPITWPFEAHFKKLIWKTEAALLLAGAGYWFKAKNRVTIKDIDWLNPYSVTVDYDGEFRFTQSTGLGMNGPYGLDKIVYFREWDPSQDTHPGIAATHVALGDSQLLNYVTRFAFHFFDGGAMPVTVLGMENVDDDERKRVEGTFKRLMGGIRNAWKVLGVRADSLEIKPLTPELDTLAIPELYKQAKENVGAAFGIPLSMLEEPSANRATADTHRLSFWGDTVRPRGEDLAYEINRQLLEDMGLELRFEFDTMDVFQEDEEQRSSSLLNLVNARIPADVAVEVLGFDLTEDQLARIAEAQEARDVQREQIITNTQAQPPEKPEGDPEEEDVNPKSIKADLRRWRKNAITRLKDGRNPARLFDSAIIPDIYKKRIYTLLQSAKGLGEIHNIFDIFLDVTDLQSMNEAELADAIISTLGEFESEA